MDIAIYQVNMERDNKRVAFLSLDELERIQGTSKIDSEIYDKVFEGEVSCENIEDVYRMFNLDHPKGYKGRSLSVSDVVEVIGTDGESTYNFCDTIGFQKVSFDPDLTKELKEEKIKAVLCEPSTVARVAEIKLDIRPATKAERMYSFSQSSQIREQTGCIGYLRADMDADGYFFSSWNNYRSDLKTDEFKTEFDNIINELRKDGGLLHDRSALSNYCYSHPESAFGTENRNEYGVRASTEKYTYLMRLCPDKGEYNLYCYCDPRYNDLFRLNDGDKICIAFPNGEKDFKTCRYIDNYHVEVGGNIFHICEFAERMEQNGNKVTPVSETPPEQGSGVLPGADGTAALKASADELPREELDVDETEKMTVLLVQPMEYPKAVTIDGSLESMQKLVGGYIEPVYIDDIVLVCNEDGKVDNLPLNRPLYNDEGKIEDIIAGSFFAAGVGDESFKSLTPEQLEKYEKLYHQPQAYIRLNGDIMAIPIDPPSETVRRRKAPKPDPEQHGGDATKRSVRK